jgi:ABC-type branched-subunit amino acid transport system substrate-binding protein
MVKRLQATAIVVGTVVLALVLAACGNAKAATQTTLNPTADLPSHGSSPGVTSNSIDVGTLATTTGALAPGFGEIVDGTQAYFDLINSQGGVNGRKIYIKYQENDGASTTNDETEARTLVEQDHVFAVVAVGTPFFTGSTFLAQSGTPTFGYVVTQDWNKYPNLFGAYGSYLDYTTEEPTAGFIASQVHAKSVAVLAYSFAPSSAPCADIAKGITHYGFHLGFEDLNYGIGASPTADVQKMKAAGVDLVFSCMEGTDNLAISQSMHQFGLNTHFVWLNGYSQSVIKANPTVMNGVLFGEQHVPFEAATQFPGTYPGLQQYLTTMQKYYPQYLYDDTAMQGWICAVQFVDGLKAIGRNVAQNRLVDEINKETDYNADGLEPPLNWVTGHTAADPPYCGAYVEDENGKTSVVFAKGNSVFSCLGANSDQAIPNPPNTPGG